MNRLPSCFFFVLTCTLASACAEPSPVDDLDEDIEQLRPVRSPTNEPPSGTNGMLPACFWAPGAQSALRTLGASALSDGEGVMPAIPLSTISAECRHVIQKVVECALPSTQILTDPVTGGQYSGWWGLAPSWSTGPLNTSGRRNVTGCMLQRLNATGVAVPIVLEGPNSAIVQDLELAEIYPVKESTVFGDIFSSTIPLTSGLPLFNAFVCWEDVLPETSGTLPLLEDRICDDLPLCGLVPVGPCNVACVPNGPYWQCRPSVASPYWTQTVRVRLEDPSAE